VDRGGTGRLGEGRVRGGEGKLGEERLG